MATVLRISGLRAVIYPNDHRPAHVHVIGSDHEALFNLHCPDGPLELRENYGFLQKELGMIAGELAANLAALCESWRSIHGYYE